jgi:hypothetical protein
MRDKFIGECGRKQTSQVLVFVRPAFAIYLLRR